MSDLEKKQEGSWLYWLVGGDLFWFHFNKEVLKQYALYCVYFFVVVKVVAFLIAPIIELIAIVIYLAFTCYTILALFQSEKLQNKVLIPQSTISNVKNLLIYFLIIAAILLALSVWQIYVSVVTPIH